jgi:hypothetical protein
MAWAICDGCRARVHWIASRGAKLAGASCPVCGEPLRGPRRGEGVSSALYSCYVCSAGFGSRIAWSEPEIVLRERYWGVCRPHLAHPDAIALARKRAIELAVFAGRDPQKAADAAEHILRAAREEVLT